MTDKSDSFSPNVGLERAIDLLRQPSMVRENLPEEFPNLGIGELETLDLLAPHVLDGAARLDNPKTSHTWILQPLGLHGQPLFGMLG